MAIAFDAASESEFYGAEHSWSHTVGTLYNRLLLVYVALYGTSQSVSSVTFGSQSLRLVAARQRTEQVRIEIWCLMNPSEGTDDITVTCNETARCTFGATSWSGVDQADNLDRDVNASSYGSEVTVDVLSAANEIVVDVIGWPFNRTASVGADQTERCNRLGNIEGLYIACAGSSEDGAGTVTMSWTLSGNANWVSIGVPLKPAAPRAARRPGMGFVHVKDLESLTGLGKNEIA